MTASEFVEWQAFYQLEQEDEKEALAEAKRKAKEEAEHNK